MRAEYSVNVCRICLENETTQSIYEKDETGINIYEKIMECVDVQIDPDCKWPNKICESCLSSLNTSYKFRIQCKNSDNIILQFLSGGIQLQYGDSETEGYILRLEEESENFTSTHAVAEKCDRINEVQEKNSDKEEEEKLSSEEWDDESAQSQLKINSQAKRKNRKKSDSKYLHICEVCGNTYKYKNSLETHMRRHLNEKPFSCEICGREFVLNGQLTCHMRTHTGEKPYECRFCKRRYADVGAKNVHERVHTGERPFKCDICSKTFMYASVLKKHALTHTDEKQYRCDYCGKKFRLRYHLTAHLNTSKHQSLIETSEKTVKLEDVVS